MTPQDIAIDIASLGNKDSFIGSTNFTQTYHLNEGYTVDDANHFGN